MVQIVWTRRALGRLEAIRIYLRQFDPYAAERLTAALLAAGNSLSEFPNRGRPATRGRRELVTVPPYIIRYKVDGRRVLIGDIKHQSELRD